MSRRSVESAQYASTDYQNELDEAQMVCSMSRKGNCWDNAPAESFFSTLKFDLAFGAPFKTRSDAKSAIFEYIEVWYNRSDFIRPSDT